MKPKSNVMEIYAPNLHPRRYLFVLLFLFSTTAAAESPINKVDPVVEKGMNLLENLACLSCHSTNGTKHIGPTLYGVLGRESQVQTPDGIHNLIIDAAYIKRSLEKPNAELVVGFPPGSMPSFDLEEAQFSALIAALEHLSSGAAKPSTTSNIPLALCGICSLLFVLFHLVLSASFVSQRVKRSLGDTGFMLLYSLTVAAALIGMIYGWSNSPFVEVWVPAPEARYIPLLCMPIIIYFFVAGFSTKSPTMNLGMPFDKELPVVGVLKITRHPANISQASWGLVHLCVNGDLASIFLFSSIATLGIVGSMHIDSRRAALGSPHWERYVSSTSIVPFWALIQGRSPTLTFRDLGWRGLVALVVYGSLLWGHSYLFGAYPFPT